MKTLLLFISLLCLASCATTDTSVPTNSLAGNSSLPDKEIIDFYGRAQWKKMREIPYDGYVILRGSTNRRGEMIFDNIVESYPDGARNDLALNYAKGMPAVTYNPGSRVKPKVEVYVVFYETYASPNRALVFSKRKGNSAPGETLGGSTYMRSWTY